jgi:hypothetical protein
MADEARSHPRFSDDLVGLDPHDPDAQAFAAHLDRMQRCEPAFTVEASINRVADFAESSHRASGLRWWGAVVVVCLILFGVVFAAWDTIGRVLQWLAE